MFNMDDISFCEKQTPYELEKILHTDKSSIKNDSYGMLKKENPNQVPSIFKTNIHKSTTKVRATTELMEKGKKLFK